MAYKTIYPYTGETLKEFPNASDAQLEEVLAGAHALYREWRQEAPAKRKPVLHKLADLLRARKTDLAKIMTYDMGKLLSEAEGEVDLCADIADYYADHGEEFMAPSPLKTEAGEAYVLKQATGVLVAVEPWNFPFYQIMRVFAPNFMVGNPMILKDASSCPASAQAFADLVIEAGAPKYSLTNMFIDYKQVEKAINDPRVAGVCLTGSERGGAAVAAEAGKALKKSTMELGGNDAFIILADADFDLLKQVAPNARLYNAGQVCTSSKRFIVMDNIYDKFVVMMKDAFSKVKLGDPMNPETVVAPLSSAKALKKVSSQVQTAVDHGAKVVYGNKPVDSKGFFFQPTILTDIDKNNPIFNQEIFGPVASIYKVHSEQEAIDLANDSSYGLGNTIFGKDTDYAKKVAAQIETGMSWINSGWASLPELPFGGVKNSGYGRELSQLGFNAFINEHLVFQPK